MTYDHWKATEPDDGAEPPDEKVYTEADMAEAVEAERAACEKIARAEVGWPGASWVVARIIAAIAARKRDTP